MGHEMVSSSRYTLQVVLNKGLQDSIFVSPEPNIESNVGQPLLV